ncbi:hypothetical protein [Nocardia brasiliensis]|uniref:hypothetical protein n=1 Tax=Nocardia brasiliensis TaxID=37326 RepID=UPI002455FD91|nr:hypothetical protein [Nocardia brasiliensis]
MVSVLALVELFIVVAVILGGLFLFVHLLTEWSRRPRRRGRGWRLGGSDQSWSAGDSGAAGDGGNDWGGGSSDGSGCGGGSSSCGGGSSS